MEQAQVENYGLVPVGNRWNMEAVFPPKNFRIFSDDFRPVLAGKHMKLTGIHRKKSKKFPVGILLPLPAISGAFLQDPVTFPLLSCRILRDPVAVIFDMGYYKKYKNQLTFFFIYCFTNLTIEFWVLLQINDTAAPTSLMPSPSLFDVPYQSDQLMYRVSSICGSTEFCS